MKVHQPTKAHMNKDVAVYMRYYNLERLHSSNGDMSPINDKVLWEKCPVRLDQNRSYLMRLAGRGRWMLWAIRWKMRFYTCISSPAYERLLSRLKAGLSCITLSGHITHCLITTVKYKCPALLAAYQFTWASCDCGHDNIGKNQAQFFLVHSGLDFLNH